MMTSDERDRLNLIRNRLSEADMSYADLGAILGCTRQNVAQMLSRAAMQTSPEVVDRTLAILGITLDQWRAGLILSSDPLPEMTRDAILSRASSVNVSRPRPGRKCKPLPAVEPAVNLDVPPPVA